MIHPCTVTEYSKGVAIGQKIYGTDELTALLYIDADGYKQWEGIKPRSKGHGKIKQVTCAWCKTEFETTRTADVKFCPDQSNLKPSQRCCNLAHRAKRIKPKITKECQMCKKSFTTNRDKRIYCLDPCSHDLYAESRPRRTKVCVCGIKFDTRHPTLKRCVKCR